MGTEGERSSRNSLLNDALQTSMKLELCRVMLDAPPPLPPPIHRRLLPRSAPRTAAGGNAAQQADELCALLAIYGDEGVQQLGGASYAFMVPEPGAHPHLKLRATLPDGYPAADPPLFELECDYLPEGLLDSLATELEAMFVPGEERWFRVCSTVLCALLGLPLKHRPEPLLPH